MLELGQFVADLNFAHGFHCAVQESTVTMESNHGKEQQTRVNPFSVLQPYTSVHKGLPSECDLVHGCILNDCHALMLIC